MAVGKVEEWYGVIVTVALAGISAFVTLLTSFFRRERDRLDGDIGGIHKKLKDIEDAHKSDLSAARTELRMNDERIEGAIRTNSDELWCAIAELRKAQSDNSSILARIDERTLTMSTRLTEVAASVSHMLESSQQRKLKTGVE